MELFPFRNPACHLKFTFASMTVGGSDPRANLSRPLFKAMDPFNSKTFYSGKGGLNPISRGDEQHCITNVCSLFALLELIIIKTSTFYGLVSRYLFQKAECR